MSKKLIIRTAEAKDNLHLAKMIRDVFIEHDAPKIGTVYSDPTTDNFYDFFKADKSTLWVAETENEILGCCGIYPTEGLEDDTAELVKFYLPAISRGKGIGKKLMERSIKSAIEFGYKKLYPESLPQFSKAVSMYVKKGFKELDEPMGNSGHTSCNIRMLKEL